MTEKEKDYKEGIDELVRQIKNIEEKSLPDWEKSDEIMELLRRQYLFVHTDYLKKKVTEEKFATLNFEEEGIKTTLNVEDKDLFDYHVVFGNSFGPFNPQAYFNCDIKILWLLKESYIDGIGSWIGDNEDNKPDRGGHDQAREYNNWEVVKAIIPKINTKRRIIEITKKILSKIDKYGGWDDNSDLTYQKVMNHICVLEVQHFPGLAFSGTSTDDKRKNGSFIRWTELNKLLVEELIQFYFPRIIIGGHTLKYFFPEGYNHNSHYQDKIYPAIDEGIIELKVFNNILINHCGANNNNWIYMNEKGQILIDADHPCLYSNYTDDHATSDGEEIKKLYL